MGGNINMSRFLIVACLLVACTVAFQNEENDIIHGKPHHGGKHHVKRHHGGKHQADENGCYHKKDGVWCPDEDGTWVRDDGKVYDPRAVTKDAETDDEGCYQKSDGLWCPDGEGGWYKKHGKHHHGRHHRFKRMCRLHMLGYLLGAVMLLLGLVWGYFERKRRREAQGEQPTRLGAYVTSLCECFGRPSVCLPACLFSQHSIGPRLMIVSALFVTYASQW